MLWLEHISLKNPNLSARLQLSLRSRPDNLKAAISDSVSPDTIDLRDVIVEEFRVTRRDARVSASALVEQFESVQSQQSVPGTARHCNCNVRLQNMKSVPMLLPVWIMVYQDRNQPFRVLVNGQTGEVFGAAPFSYAKLTGVVAGLSLVIILVIIAVVLFSSMR